MEDIDFSKLDFGRRNPYKNKIKWNHTPFEKCCLDNLNTYRGQDGKFHGWGETICPKCKRWAGFTPDK